MTLRSGFPFDGARKNAVLMRRIEQERIVARDTVDRLLRDTPRSEWPALAEHSDLATCGALERLANLFAEELTKDPLHAIAIAELAVAAAEGLGPNSYPTVIVAQLQALAWKDFGKALRFLGKNEEAIDAFHTGEEKLAGCAGLAHDLAIVRFNLATSLQEVGRYDESRDLIVECKQVFRDHGDHRNTLMCGLAEGVLLQRLKRFREAREIYLLVLASSRQIDDGSLAAIHHAIGFCSVDLGDFEDAEANLTHAATLYRSARQPIEIIKVELGRGRLLIRKGQPGRAIDHLRRVRREFLHNGLREEAGLCGLEIVEALLMLERASEAETLARKIVREFMLANLSTRAVTALGYLTEAIIARKAQPALAVRVREYILSLRSHPEREFEPAA